MQASQRLDRFGAEVFASLNNKLLALKAQGKTIYNMSVGTPDFKPYDHVVEALTQAAQDPEMWKYALRDLPELKQAVCDYYERRFGVSGITPSMVQSCNGTQEGWAIWALPCSIRVTPFWFPIRATRSLRRVPRSPMPSSNTIRWLPSTITCPMWRVSIPGCRSCQVHDRVAAREPGRLGGHARGLRGDYRLCPRA